MGVDHKTAGAITCRHPTRGTLSGIAGNRSWFFLCVANITTTFYADMHGDWNLLLVSLFYIGQGALLMLDKKVTPYKFYP